jgi:3-hydroxybutyryl-CoA dehydrogenase
MTELPTPLGVVGAGTMGAGIAQLGCLAGIETLLHDPVPAALDQGAVRIREGLQKGAARGRWPAEDAVAAAERLHTVDSLEGLCDAELVIEAAPERIELKRELFERLSEICGDDAILATNTSSILVSSLASSAKRPENVVGMHFFNPPPLMKLLEVIAAEQTGERALDLARAVGEAMGKTVIVAQDGPGFLVNRCGRPFGGEALRLLQERVASVEQIDRIVRLGGGFRMGPFELMDLVGVDVGFEVAQSFTAQSFGEARWKPSMLQAKLVAAGQLGRKTGRGWYSYEDGAHRPADPEPREPGGGDGRVVSIPGSSRLAYHLRERAQAAGFELGDGDPWLTVGSNAPPPAPQVVTCSASSLAARRIPGAAGFHLLPPIGQLVELTRVSTTSDESAQRAEEFFTALGLEPEWVADAPGLVLGRIVCCLVNEALFAVGEGVGTADDVDTGLTLGLNHPRGAVSWGREIGFDHVWAAINGLYNERHEERYRAAPLLRRIVDTGESVG